MAVKFETLSPDFNWRADQVDWPVTTDTAPGMSGVIACDTNVAWLNPNTGELSYRGIPIRELALKATFEEVAYLLVEGKHWKNRPEEFQSFCERLHRVRQMPMQILNIISSQSAKTHPTRLLRAVVSAIGCFEMTAKDTREDSHWEDVWIISQVAALVGNIARYRKGLRPLISDYRQSLAKDMLYMILNTKPTKKQIRLLDLLWVLYADHGLDATTFTGIIVGSTRADPYYNIVAGLSAMRGRNQGGTVERVMRMLLGLRDANVARAWTKAMLAKKYVIPGFGHRMYNQSDPRVRIIKRVIPEYAVTPEQKLLLEVAMTIEDTASERLAEKGVFVNINFYSALLFHYLGVEPEMVPCFYAVGRMAGLVARMREYLKNNRLFRPRERYIGETDRIYRPLEKR